MKIHIGLTPKLARVTTILGPDGLELPNVRGVDLIAGTLEVAELAALGQEMTWREVLGDGHRVQILDGSFLLASPSQRLADGATDAVMLTLWRVLGGPREAGDAPVDVTEDTLRAAVEKALAPFTASTPAPVSP